MSLRDDLTQKGFTFIILSDLQTIPDHGDGIIAALGIEDGTEHVLMWNWTCGGSCFYDTARDTVGRCWARHRSPMHLAFKLTDMPRPPGEFANAFARVSGEFLQLIQKHPAALKG